METAENHRLKNEQSVELTDNDFVKIEIENISKKIDAGGCCGNTNICDSGAYALQ